MQVLSGTNNFNESNNDSFDGLLQKECYLKENPKAFLLVKNFSPDIFAQIFKCLDIKSIINLQRGGNRRILYSCGVNLRTFFWKCTELDYSQLRSSISVIRPHRPNWILLRNEENGFDHFFKFTANLTYVNLSRAPSWQVGPVTKCLDKCTQLSALNLSNIKLTPDLITYWIFPYCPPNLNYLDLSNIELLNDSILAMIGDMFCDLEHISLSSSGKKLLENKVEYNLSVSGLGFLMIGCKKLKSLHIHDIGIRSSKIFSHCKQLTSLDISNNRSMSIPLIVKSSRNLTSLNLINLELDLEAFESIAEYCKQLKVIRLSRISDIQLQVLSRCTRLQRIYTQSKHSLEDEGVQWVFQNCPDLIKFQAGEKSLDIS